MTKEVVLPGDDARDERLDGRPRVVVVAQGPPSRGGISTFATTLVDDEELARTFEMSLLNTCREEERAAGTWSIDNLRHAAEDAVRTFVAARRADVVHVQTALMPTLPLVRALVLCLAARLGGAAVLCHVHSGRVNSGQQEAFAPRWHQRLLLRGLSQCDAVLTVSLAGADALRPLVGRTLVEPVDNAVPTSTFVTSTLDGRPPKLVYVGTLSMRKGLADLMAALELLAGRGGPGYRLEVVGGSAEVGEAEAEQLRDAVRRAGHELALVGSRSAAQVREHLRTADVFVLPSHWEGQPIAILEAMATGLPVVVTSVGANAQVVRDGVEGFVVPPHDPPALADALARVLADEELRRRLGAAARARAVERHDTAQLRLRMTEVLSRVTARQGTSA